MLSVILFSMGILFFSPNLATLPWENKGNCILLAPSGFSLIYQNKLALICLGHMAFLPQPACVLMGELSPWRLKNLAKVHSTPWEGKAWPLRPKQSQECDEGGVLAHLPSFSRVPALWRLRCDSFFLYQGCFSRDPSRALPRVWIPERAGPQVGSYKARNFRVLATASPWSSHDSCISS